MTVRNFRLFIFLTVSAALTACASPQADSTCDAAYPVELRLPMVYSHLSAITGEETVNQQRRTVKASLTCNLTWHASADDRITYECFGFDLQTERHIEITPTLARVLIDALHLNNVPEDRSDAGIIRYSLESIQCVENEGCSTMVIPPCLP